MNISLKTHSHLVNEDDYLQWKNNKLDEYPLSASQLFTNIESSSKPTEKEIIQIKSKVKSYNLAFYRFLDTHTENKTKVHTLGKHLGLMHLDNNLCADNDKLTSIEARLNAGQHNYIPYSTSKLSWHTDGYYNPEERKICGMLLHCVHPALSGGVSMLMDTDIAYILLREEDPRYIDALMQPDALTIPANILQGKTIRPEQSGPVFSINPAGQIHMRYSARQKNITWKNDKYTLEAADFLQSLWKSNSEYIIEYKFEAGEGVVCNNVLHCRTHFQDSNLEDEKRLLYRGRYLDSIAQP